MNAPLPAEDVARLRKIADEVQKHFCVPYAQNIDDAADEIEGLRHDIERHLAVCSEQATEIERLRAALDSFVKIADEAATQWDNDNDARVGKMLLAMSGHAPRYRADIDAIHALRRGAADVPAEPQAPKVGDACPVCSARLGNSQNQVRCANCGWLGTYTPHRG